MDTFIKLIEIAARHFPRPMALATIVDVVGSAYRKEGAMMLLLEDSSRYGLLSAGCLEEDVAERAKEVRASGVAQIVHYDTSDEDDLSWGRGAGCNGKISILIEPVNEVLFSRLIEAKRRLDERKPITRLINFSPHFDVEDDFFIEENGEVPGTKSRLLTGLHVDKQTNCPFFIHHLLPQPHLIIFGAGKDARPVVSLAAQTGFKVTVADGRPGLCTEEHFPDAVKLIPESQDSTLSGISFAKEDFILIMTHEFETDQAILIELLTKGPFAYLGVLGPSDRTSRLLNGRRKPEWLHSPAGLSLGAKGPVEIAVSIVAQLISILRGKEASE
ncbi:XdhC family protein [Bacillus sp. B-jedd]|uniref:XdhC family protein n=1 Tax=Bacillus sp. B-jedd TaxID=1476857 RepID=UPI0005155E5C|nr:XdhC family protein [Bacillus sp. B-jedd]CEG28931.1 xanthine dehydrogenase [Bacillus sp. B-jedd]